MCPAKQTSDQTVSALVVGGAEISSQALDRVFRDLGWTLRVTNNRREVRRVLASGEVQVVIADTADTRVNWRTILSEAGRLEHPPMVVVTSRLADDYLWSEVLNRGGYDVLAQPFDPEEVRRVVASARRRYQPAA